MNKEVQCDAIHIQNASLDIKIRVDAIIRGNFEQQSKNNSAIADNQ